MYNLKNNQTIDKNYEQGLLPQRNRINLFYQQTSCRSNLSDFILSSENRRIIRKTDQFNYQLIPLTEFNYTHSVQKEIHGWSTELDWHFPTNSLKTIFTKHIFNYVYIWSDLNHVPIAYSVCYFSDSISHIGYVFYHPQYHHGNLPIRLVLQFIIDSQQKKLKFAYLGRFSTDHGYYKRNMPGFEFFQNQRWSKKIT